MATRSENPLVNPRPPVRTNPIGSAPRTTRYLAVRQAAPTSFHPIQFSPREKLTQSASAPDLTVRSATPSPSILAQSLPPEKHVKSTSKLGLPPAFPAADAPWPGQSLTATDQPRSSPNGILGQRQRIADFHTEFIDR